MRSVVTAVILLIFVHASVPAFGQQDMPQISSAIAGLAAPVILPSNSTISTPKDCVEFNGVVRFSTMIDSAGVPRVLKTTEASDERLVSFARKLIEAQRFRPAVLNGSATAVAVELTVGLHTCAHREKAPIDNNFYRFTLRAHPLIALAVVASPTMQEAASEPIAGQARAEQVGQGISAPIPIVLTDPKIPISGKLRKRGHCFLGVTIDPDGIPQDVHVIRGLDPELDSAVMNAVKSWRFRPALRDSSTPVAVQGIAVGSFEYVEKEPVAFANFVPVASEEAFVAEAHERKRHNELEPLNADEIIARYMPQSRISGTVLVSLVVDTHGVPQNVRVIKGLDSSLDLDTVAMVEHLRFKPVLEDATTPIPVGVVVPVHYRSTIAKPTWKDVFAEGMTLALLAWM